MTGSCKSAEGDGAEEGLTSCCCVLSGANVGEGEGLLPPLAEQPQKIAAIKNTAAKTNITVLIGFIIFFIL